MECLSSSCGVDGQPEREIQVMKRMVLFASCVALVQVLVVMSAVGDNRNWTSATGGEFTTSGNWDTYPGTGDVALFNLDNTYPVTFAASVTNLNAKFNASDGDVTLNIGSGKTWELTGTEPTVSDGSGKSNVVTLCSGEWSVKEPVIGKGSGGYGRLNISGGTFAVQSGQLRLGQSSGQGTIVISGGSLTTPGLICVPRSGWTTPAGTGLLDISGSGSVSCDDLSISYATAGSQGAVDMSGGTLTVADDLTVAAADDNGTNELPRTMGNGDEVIRFLDRNGSRSDYAVRSILYKRRVPEELYDTKQDPGCLNNLVANPECQETVAGLRERMLQLMSDVEDAEQPNYREYIGSTR
jgi:hypothetical protein